MFKRTVKYKDFNGVDHAEDLYFNLSTPEMLDLQFNAMVDGDMDKFVKTSIESGEGRKLWTIFKLLIVNSYGRRSEDGSQFRKRPEWTDEFLDSPAYEKFFEWLLIDSPDGKNANQFYLGIMPERLRDEDEVKRLTQAAGGKQKQKLTEIPREELEKLYLERMTQNANNPRIIEG